jgi:hypothetical protein
LVFHGCSEQSEDPTYSSILYCSEAPVLPSGAAIFGPLYGQNIINKNNKISLNLAG